MIKLRRLIQAGSIMLLLATAASSRADEGICKNLDSDQCRCVRAVMTNWKSQRGTNPELVIVTPERAYGTEQPSIEADAAAAQELARHEITGPCRFEEGEDRIALTEQAFRLSDESLARCLATAVAQARYPAIESRWLATTGAKEAWVVRRGLARKVELDQKLAPPAARALWASLATRELLNAVPTDGGSTGAGRAVASSEQPAAPRGGTDPEVRALLGLD